MILINIRLFRSDNSLPYMTKYSHDLENEEKVQVMLRVVMVLVHVAEVQVPADCSESTDGNYLASPNMLLTVTASVVLSSDKLKHTYYTLHK